MLHKLEQNDLYLKPEKCDFEKKEIDYLGVIVGNGQIQMDPKSLRESQTGPSLATQQKSVNSLDSQAIIATSSKDTQK